MELKEYIRIFITVTGGLISVVGFLLWRILHRIEQKLDELHQLSHRCREALPERFASRCEHEQYQLELNKVWEALNYHDHDRNGRVLR